MEEEYRELFDGVHASEHLRTEVMRMSTQQRKTGKRPIPAAALAAALLAVVLAGTALGAGIVRRVEVQNLEDGEPGYSARAEIAMSPLENLSEEALAFAAETGDGADIRCFSSWDEAEAFLGLEIADNPVLDGMEKYIAGIGSAGKPTANEPCAVVVHSTAGVPSSFEMAAGYRYGSTPELNEAEGLVGQSIFVTAKLVFDSESGGLIDTGESFYFCEGSTILVCEEYVTPGGLEATLVSFFSPQREVVVVSSSGEPDGSTVIAPESVMHIGYFLKENAFFRVHAVTSPDESEQEAARAVIKDVLDNFS